MSIARIPHAVRPGPLLMRPSCASDSQDKVHNDSSQQSNRQHRRTESVIEPALSPHPDALRPPMKRDQCVYHRRHCDQCEKPG